MIRDIHRILLSSARGRDKGPGEIRRIQNYIAPHPSTPIEEATFVPPEPLKIMDALSNWENYLHQEEKDPLIQLAVLKAQFEIIHPFKDGNGRIGRMLVPLILYYKDLLSSPMFYISAYLERNRDEYYDRLLAVSQEGDWNGWISFFLRAIREQAEDNSRKATSIINLYEEMKTRVPEITRSQYTISAIDTIFSQPIFTSTYFIEKSGIQRQTAYRILRELEEQDILGILSPGRGRKPTVYIFPQLMSITEGWDD